MGPQTHRPPFQQARAFDGTGLHTDGHVTGPGPGPSLNSYDRPGYYTVGRPSNLAFSTRSKSLQASPTASLHPPENGPGEPAWAQEVAGASPRRIPITVRHEPPRLSRFNSDGGRPVHDETREDALYQHQGQGQQRQQRQLQGEQSQPQPDNQSPRVPWSPSHNRTIPITHRRSRRHSEEEPPSLHPAASSKLSSLWQGSASSLQHSDRGPGFYSTLPSKGSQQRARHFPQQQQHLHNHQPQQQQYPQHYQQHQQPQQEGNLYFEKSTPFRQPSDPTALAVDTYASLPTIKPLKSSSSVSSVSESREAADGRVGHSFRSSNNRLPAVKTSQSSFEFGDLRDLEHTLEDSTGRKDFSKPLWANTDLDRSSSQRSSVSSSQGEETHSDNAVSSSDSRDTIIAREERAALEFFHRKEQMKGFAQTHAQQDSRPEDRSMDYLNSHREREARDQHRLGPKTSPKPSRRIPVAVVHEQNRPGHVVDENRGKGHGHKDRVSISPA